ncbi:MAG: hypothetical protein OK474_11585 [Thaumarchaeota archaeon]|nr:hypothetical protein [Nitrososphaerota archaeon]
MVSNTRRIALGSLFGVSILAVIGTFPPPTSDYLIGFQAFFLALSFLVVGKGGATYVGIVSGILITFVKISFFPLDLVFAIAFGVTVDALSLALRAKDGTNARTGRLVAAMTVSTTVVGFIAYYVAVVLTGILPNALDLDASVLVFGIVSGAIAGFAAARVWNRYLKSRI